MKIPITLTESIRRLVSSVVDPTPRERNRRERWSYWGSFGDDFFGDGQ